MKVEAPAQRSKARRIVRVTTLALAAIFLFSASVAVFGQDRPIRIEKFNLSRNGKVKVENFRGAVRVEEWNEPLVKVVAEKRKPAKTPLQQSELKLMGMNGDVTVQCEQTGQPDRIDLTIYVPQDAQLQVAGGAWPVDVDASLASAVVKTTSGDIGYRLPPSDNARVVMHSGKGVVRSAVAMNVDQKIGLRTLEGSLGDGSSPIILSSASGNITLMPSRQKIAAVVSDENGELQLNQPTRQRAGNSAGQEQSPNVQSARGQYESQDNSIAVPPADRQGQSPSGSAGNSQGGYTPDLDPPPPAVRSTAGSGETVFAGRGETTESSATVKSGVMIPRPTKRSDTGEDSMGLKVRIIPSDSTSGGAGDPRYPNQSAIDHIYSSGDQTQGGQSSSANSSSTSSGGSTSSNGSQSNSGLSGGGAPPPSVSGSNSDFVFAGRGSAQESKSTTVTSGGIIPRPRNQTDAREDNMGLRVRIIPSGATAGSSGDPRYSSQKSGDDIWPQRDRQKDRSSSILYDSATDTGTASSAGSPEVQPAPTRRDPFTADSQPRGGSLDSPQPASAKAPRPLRPSSDAIVLTSSLVSFNVSVTDKTGKIISGLDKKDFTIYENNEPQQVEFFAPSTAPFNLVLLLDLSGSIADRLDVVKAAALHFIDVLGPQDKVAIATFTRQITVLSQLTSDKDLLRKRIKAIRKPEGGTAFYEAMWFSLAELLRGTQGQRNAIVVVSDGVDNSLDRFNPANSRVSFPQLIRKLENSDCIVFPIYVDTEYEEVFVRGNTTSEAYAIARDQLARMAEVTGGEAFKAQQPEDLAGVYSQVANAIRTVYSVGYYPTNAQRDGTFRKVSVGVDKAGVVVRTRRGYYAN